MSQSINARTPAYWGDIFIDFIIGVVVLLFQPRWLSWAVSRLFHTPFDDFRDQNTGAIVPYPQVAEFWSDLGPTLFGLVMIVVTVLMCIRRRWSIAAALGLTAISTLYNVGYTLVSYKQFGLPVISVAAAVFGGFLITRQWQMISPKAAVS